MYRQLDSDLESQPGKLPIWDREIIHTIATRAGPSLLQLMDFAESFSFFPWVRFPSPAPLSGNARPCRAT
jgi:hypothetical protein